MNKHIAKINHNQRRLICGRLPESHGSKRRPRICSCLTRQSIPMAVVSGACAPLCWLTKWPLCWVKLLQKMATIALQLKRCLVPFHGLMRVLRRQSRWAQEALTQEAKKTECALTGQEDRRHKFKKTVAAVAAQLKQQKAEKEAAQAAEARAEHK